MLIIPAIDLKEGKCVRLAQGDFQRVNVYSDSPADVAARWEQQGARRIHVVDLDGSLHGAPKNRVAIEEIVRRVTVPVELGGGIRDMATIEAYLEMGVHYAILGTAALRDEALVKEACRRHEGRIIIGIDAREGRVAVQGWTELGSSSALEIAKLYEDDRPAAIVYTDIKRDGMEQGVNIEQTKSLAEAISIPVIASGGVSTLGDIDRLLEIEGAGVVGVIIGKALYTGALSLPEVLARTGAAR
ncbi:MAG: 1-(5-phosphoribosyl)-5-[(5-phosphoribosylamino)methylideneamino]imidazole-4-carboxamide isomerase [Smithellaceae bacterium]|nr:1-(5-phosphoribosyl)-5-[(5-phosphoribosylamino)methylideneamino]imidazole-4-carboxamide isomerase [Smithellaceae bacterium]